MEKKEAKKKLEEISENIRLITDKYHGERGYGKVEKEKMLKDFQAVFAESQNLQKLFEEFYDQMPESFNNITRGIDNYGNGVSQIAILISTQIKI
jgi:hypothetical protein